jgi:ribonuclease E
MSDHWNSLANLLGTPSVDPVQKKKEEPARPVKPNHEAASQAKDAVAEGRAARADKLERSSPPEISPAAAGDSESPSQAEKPKSGLRASWDAVARIFGVGSVNEVEPQPIKEVRSTTPAPAASLPTDDDDLFAGFKKGRPDRGRATQEPLPPKGENLESVSRPAAKTEAPSKRSTSDGRGSGKRQRPPSAWSDAAPEEASPRGASPELDEITTEPRSIEQHREERPRPSREPAADDLQSERRGRRRVIRRGRATESSEDEAREEAPPHRQREERRERAGRDLPNRETRPPRTPRGEDSFRDRESLEKAPFEGEEPSNLWDAQESPSEEAGLENHGQQTSFSTAEEGDEERPKRRRRRRGGRGRKSEESPAEVSELDAVEGRQAYGRRMAEEEDTEDEPATNRIFKVTSWLDAISPIINANMENHKRSSSHDHRGRGNYRGGSRRRGGPSS